MEARPSTVVKDLYTYPESLPCAASIKARAQANFRSFGSTDAARIRVPVTFPSVILDFPVDLTRWSLIIANAGLDANRQIDAVCALCSSHESSRQKRFGHHPYPSLSRTSCEGHPRPCVGIRRRGEQTIRSERQWSCHRLSRVRLQIGRSLRTQRSGRSGCCAAASEPCLPPVSTRQSRKSLIARCFLLANRPE